MCALSKQYIFKTKIKDTQEMKLLALLLLGRETVSILANGGRVLVAGLGSRSSKMGAEQQQEPQAQERRRKDG